MHIFYLCMKLFRLLSSLAPSTHFVCAGGLQKQIAYLRRFITQMEFFLWGIK